MKRLIIAVASMTLSAGAAGAAGTHAGGHGEIAIGKPGEAADINRTVRITMLESDDGEMLFKPASLKVRAGETIRLKFVNTGGTDHEFVMDRHDDILEHKELMEKFPEMEHDDANAIRLAPGTKGEIIWTFTTAGDFGFACLIPGHYESGMKGLITVSH